MEPVITVLHSSLGKRERERQTERERERERDCASKKMNKPTKKPEDPLF